MATHARNGHQDLVVLRHAKRRPSSLQHPNDVVALRAHQHVLAHRVLPRFEEPGHDGLADHDHRCARGDFVVCEVSALGDAQAADAQVEVVHALDAHVGVGAFAASGDGGHAGAVDRSGDFKRPTCLFLELHGLPEVDGAAGQDAFATEHAATAHLVDGEALGAQRRKFLTHVGLEGFRGGDHGDEGHDANANDAHRQGGAQHLPPDGAQRHVHHVPPQRRIRSHRGQVTSRRKPWQVSTTTGGQVQRSSSSEAAQTWSA